MTTPTLKDSLFDLLDTSVLDHDEETFALFCQPIPSSRDLGFVDSRSTSLTLAINENLSFTVRQSPTLLSSSRAEGTTGAVLWRISPLIAEWLLLDDNVLFRGDVPVLRARKSVVIELGCGIAGIVALSAARRVGKWVATDLGYVLKVLRVNVEDNTIDASTAASRPPPRSRSKLKPKGKDTETGSNVQVLELDWETDDITALPDAVDGLEELDMVIGCDCIYNEALVEPFVRTCAQICALNTKQDKPVVCLVAQQLRSDLVFDLWLKRFMDDFVVWRISDEHLLPGLRSGSGFVVHVGILKADAIHASS